MPILLHKEMNSLLNQETDQHYPIHLCRFKGNQPSFKDLSNKIQSVTEVKTEEKSRYFKDSNISFLYEGEYRRLRDCSCHSTSSYDYSR